MKNILEMVPKRSLFIYFKIIFLIVPKVTQLYNHDNLLTSVVRVGKLTMMECDHVRNMVTWFLFWWLHHRTSGGILCKKQLVLNTLAYEEIFSFRFRWCYNIIFRVFLPNSSDFPEFFMPPNPCKIENWGNQDKIGKKIRKMTRFSDF